MAIFRFNRTTGAGQYNATPPTVTDGTEELLQIDTRGNLKVSLWQANSSSNYGTSVAVSDGQSSPGSVPVAALEMLWNGATFDRRRGNVDQTVGITAVGVTTTQTGADQTNYNGRGLHVVLDMTTVGTGSVTLTIQGKDATSGKYYTLLAGAAVVTNSTNVYKVYPGLPATANVSANDLLPRTWRILVTANNANATTYTVGASVIL